MTKISFSPAQARRIALAAQGFDKPRRAGQTGWPGLHRMIERMGLLQIDSINTVIRSHYLPLFSRVGSYDITRFEQKAFGTRKRALFEYWGHEASLLPFAMHPLLRWRMARAERLEGIYAQVATIAREKPEYVAGVLAQLHERGPLSARELSDRGGGGGWWSWHDGKAALEYLFWTGRITTASRRGFERVYDLTERVVPAHILDVPTPAEADAQRELVRMAARSLGIATASDLRDYYRLPAGATKQRIAELLEAGELIAAEVEGWQQAAYLHPDARIPARIRTSALLSPFDPLVWERARTERLFDFHYRIEIYTPAPKRRYGYYVLPFLLDEHLVGRVDVKADRVAGVLRVPAAYGEADIDEAGVAQRLAGELRNLADWLGLGEVDWPEHRLRRLVSA